MFQPKQVNQVSFEKGMIENVKQESFGESLGSCLILENWDNSVEIGSVLKRSGIVTNWDTFPRNFVDNTDWYNGNLLSRFKDIKPTDKVSIPCHANAIGTSNPQVNDTYIILAHNYNYPEVRCRVLSFVPYNRDDGEINVNWRNSLNPDDGILPQFRGWDIRGLYKCSSVYGESMLIGTQPYPGITPNQSEYFPLYLWKLMDLSKKRETADMLYWNGLNFDIINNLKQSRVFNVRTPRQALRNNNFCKVIGFNGYTGGFYGTDNDCDLGVIVVEEELRLNSFYSFDRWKTTDKFDDNNIKSMCYPNPNVQRWYQKGVKVVKSFERPTFPFADNIESKITDTPRTVLGLPDKNFKAVRRFITTQSGIDLDIISMLGPGSWNTPITNLQAWLPQYAAHEYNVTDDCRYFEINHNGIKDQFKGYSGSSTNYIERCLTFAMPDYISNNEPRCWTKGEVIPLVITANFNGHEVLLKTLEYTVNGGELAYPRPETFMNWNERLNTSKVLALKQYYKDGDRSIWIEPFSHESTVPSTNDQYRKPYHPTRGECFYRYLNDLSNTNNSEFGVDLEYYEEGTVGDEYKFYPKILSHQDFGSNGNTTGYYPVREHEEVCPKNYNALRICLRLSENMVNWCTANEVTSLKVYIAKGDLSQKSHLKSCGVLSRQEVPLGLYHKPVSKAFDKDKVDYSQYGLVKEFLIEGTGDIPREYEDKETFAITTRLRTNSWYLASDGNYYSVPINDSNMGSKAGTPMEIPPEVLLKNNAIDFPTPDFENAFTKYRVAGTMPPSTVVYRMIPKDQIQINAIADKRWTPDFYIHDYAYNAPTLQLNTDGRYWDGTGCDVVTVIKGRAFIANWSEQALVRYSAAQNGVILPDLFNKEDKITVGHGKITAMVEYREQLLVFNEHDIYRITLPNIFDESTWEFLEAMSGQGTISPKTICKTPYGVAFCNRNGIWFTDGREPQNIGMPVTSFYQTMATNNPYIYADLYPIGNPLSISSTTKFNDFLEIVYDSNKDELAVISPMFDDENQWELRLIYSFKSQSWKMERYDIQKWENNMYTLTAGVNEKAQLVNPYTNNYPTMPNNLPFYYNAMGSYHFDYFGIQSLRVVYDGQSEGFFEHLRKETNAYNDISWGWMPTPIRTMLVTHEIGDGENDFIGHKLLYDGIARERHLQILRSKDNTVISHNVFGFRDYSDPMKVQQTKLKRHDPQVNALFRNSAYTQAGNSQFVSRDLTQISLNGKIALVDNLFDGSTNTPWGNVGIEVANSREAVTLLMPLHSKFRRMRYMITSEVTAKLYGLTTEVQVSKRRFQ